MRRESRGSLGNERLRSAQIQGVTIAEEMGRNLFDVTWCVFSFEIITKMLQVASLPRTGEAYSIPEGQPSLEQEGIP
ncbi:hypothetical protein GH733_019001 [Mirounga leonina]|nr:hypothetical protein GH733_019001 [Mirounga leonina]